MSGALKEARRLRALFPDESEGTWVKFADAMLDAIEAIATNPSATTEAVGRLGKVGEETWFANGVRLVPESRAVAAEERERVAVEQFSRKLAEYDSEIGSVARVVRMLGKWTAESRELLAREMTERWPEEKDRWAEQSLERWSAVTAARGRRRRPGSGALAGSHRGDYRVSRPDTDRLLRQRKR